MTISVADEQLGQLARRQNDLFRRVREGTLPVEQVLRGLQNLIEGNVPAGRLAVDFDATAWCPDGWEVRPEDQLPNRVRGQPEVDLGEVGFHLDDVQKDGRIIGGNKLKDRIATLPAVYGSQMLDGLLADTAKIPESWKKNANGFIRYTYFWGTIYRDGDGYLYVRCLFFGNGEWRWGSLWLGGDFGGGDPAAVPAS